jgi:hypothetical protein
MNKMEADWPLQALAHQINLVFWYWRKFIQLSRKNYGDYKTQTDVFAGNAGHTVGNTGPKT